MRRYSYWLPAVLLFLPRFLFADVLRVNFESFSDGESITIQIPGLLFTNTTVLTAGFSLNEIDFPPHSGTHVAFDDGGPISILFSAPVVDFSAYFTYTTQLDLTAYGASGNLVATTSSLFGNNTGTSGDLGSSPNELIGLSIASGFDSVSIVGDPAGASFVMDDVSVSSVPEPGSMWLILTVVSLMAIYSVNRCATARGMQHRLTQVVKIAVARRPRQPTRLRTVSLATLILVSAVSLCAQPVLLPINSLIPDRPLIYTSSPNPTTVTFVANVSPNPAILPGGVTLSQVTSTGALIQVIGQLYDDGSHGDALAGDNNYTLKVPVSSATATQMYYKATVAFRGVIVRGQSPIATVTIAPPSSSTAPLTTTLVTDSNKNVSPSNQVLFTVPPNTPPSTVNLIVGSLNATVIGFSSSASQYQIQLPPGVDPSTIVTSLTSNPNVSGAGKNYLGTPQGAVVNDLTNLHSINPSNIAAYDKIQAIAAFQALYDLNVPFVPVKLGIVDTGVFAAHPEFNGTVDFGQTPASAKSDSNGHGTSVTGIIGASDCYWSTLTTKPCGAAEMNGLLAGVPGASASGSAIPYTLEVRTSANTPGTLTDQIFASDLAPTIDDLAAHGASVVYVGYSWPSLPQSDPAFNTYTCAFVAVAQKYPTITFVVPAGDSGVDAGAMFPANLGNSSVPRFCPGLNPSGVFISNVVAVGATDLTDSRAQFGPAACPTPPCSSNFGASVAVAAPGKAVYAPTVGVPYTNSFEGTSASAAMVEAAMGLLKALNVGCLPADITSLLQLSADPITTDQPIGKRLNLANALKNIATSTDVYFLVDDTGSVGSTVGPFAQNAAKVINSLSNGCFHNFQFGYGLFRDYPISPFGLATDYAYHLGLSIGPSSPNVNGVFPVSDALSKLISNPPPPGTGGDNPEAQLAALYQSATGVGQTIAGYPTASITAGQQAGWRPESDLKILVIFTDDQFHRPGDPGIIPYPGPSFSDTVSGLNAKGIKVIGVQAHQGGGATYLPQSTADLQTIASGTGAVAPAGGVAGCLVNGTQITAGQPLVCQVPSPNADPTGNTTTSLITSAILALVDSYQ